MTANSAPLIPASRTQIGEKEYLAERVDDQIDWYSSKSRSCQTRHKVIRVTEVVAAAMIPFLSGLGAKVPHGAWIVGVLGALIAVAAASYGIFKYHENWIQYRATSEQLRHEKYLYLARIHPYSDGDAFQVLVLRVEGLISKENSTWTKTAKSAIEPDNHA